MIPGMLERHWLIGVLLWLMLLIIQDFNASRLLYGVMLKGGCAHVIECLKSLDTHGVIAASMYVYSIL